MLAMWKSSATTPGMPTNRKYAWEAGNATTHLRTQQWLERDTPAPCPRLLHFRHVASVLLRWMHLRQ